jgi:hypothetical protein
MQLSKRLPYFLVAACSILYFLPFLHLLSHQGDEGTLITGALRVTEGQLPFRDFFEVMGPGTFYWLALFFKLLGTTWLATRICLLFTTLGITLLLFYLTRRLRCGMEAVPVIFFVAVSYHNWNAITHHTDSILFGLASFAALTSWMDQPRGVMLFLAGAGAGLTTWFMLPKGVMLCLSFALVLWILYRGEFRIRSLLMLLGGYFLAIASGLALFWRAGGLPDLIYANLLWPLTNYSGINAVPYGLEFRELYWDSFTASFGAVTPLPVATAISAFLSIPFLIVMGLPVVLLTLGLRYKRISFDRVVLPYWFAGFAFWFSEMHRKDLPHIAYGSPVLVILAFYLYRQMHGKWPTRALQLIGISALSLALLNPLVALCASMRCSTPRGSMYVFNVDGVLDFLTTRVKPGEAIFVYPYAPMYYFLSATRNPTRYSILMYQINTESQFREAVQSLETSNVRYVVWDRSFPQWINNWFPAYRNPPRDKLIMEPYLVEHYRVVGSTDTGFQFLERKNSLPMPEVLPVRSAANIQ